MIATVSIHEALQELGIPHHYNPMFDIITVSRPGDDKGPILVITDTAITDPTRKNRRGSELKLGRNANLLDILAFVARFTGHDLGKPQE